jgi:ribosomal protein L11 methyltransferase
VHFSKTIIEETNWNEVWESNFQPVIVDLFVGIRAGFHNAIKDVEHEIVITPKMSFGTGHHATTYMMIEQMKNISFAGAAVFDFGTGTGILAILSEKLGAGKILAVDHDDWSIENAKENVVQNNCTRVEIRKADSARVEADFRFDIILANINKNVILDNFSILAKQLSPKGVLIISGLLKEDEIDILGKIGELGLRPGIRLERHNWLCLSLSY